jgi:hypothetical protein
MVHDPVGIAVEELRVALQILDRVLDALANAIVLVPSDEVEV